LLEADSIRKGTTLAGWEMVLEEYSRGVVKDWKDLPGELHDAFGNGLRKVHEELSDWDNWVVLGETLRDSGVDFVKFVSGDPETVLKVGGNMKKGIETAAQVAGTLYAAAENDPSGAAAGMAKILLGVENWEKALDKDTPVSERLARVAWGIFETGGALYSAGATGLKVLDKVQDMARTVDKLSGASKTARALDKTTDAAVAADKAAGAKRVADPEALAELRLPMPGYGTFPAAPRSLVASCTKSGTHRSRSTRSQTSRSSTTSELARAPRIWNRCDGFATARPCRSPSRSNPRRSPNSIPISAPQRPTKAWSVTSGLASQTFRRSRTNSTSSSPSATQIASRSTTISGEM
jgi:hypothetical protein